MTSVAGYGVASRVFPRWLCLAASSLLLQVPASATTEHAFRDWKSLRDQQVVRQERDFSCGLAALATLLTYYFDHPVSEAQLLARLDLPDAAELVGAAGSDDASQKASYPRSLTERGVSLATLVRLAAEYGYDARGIRIDPAALSRLSMPAIAYVEPGGEPHFTLIRGVDRRGRVQVADPSWGNRLFSAADFARVFAPQGATSGSLLVVLPPESSPVRTGWFGIDRALPLMQPF